MSELDRRGFLVTLAATLAPGPLTADAPAVHARSARRFDLVVRGGRLLDPGQGIDGLRDIGITAGKVALVADSISESEASRVLDATGRIVTPGLIDVHAHVFDGVAQVAIQPDVVGVSRGVTTLIDGGSAGATTFGGFREYIARPARTRVYALLNIATPGMTVPNELADLAWVDPEAAVATIEANRDVIVGLKVRMLAGIPGGGDLEVMRRTREAADAAAVPIMVHIGGQTSPLPRILELLRPGDVVTHALRRQGSILDASGRVYPEVREAMARGVHLDVGHGRGNLDFDVAEAAFAQGVAPTTISSDVHRGNVAGPVYGLPTTLSKFRALGMTLPQVVEAATAAPARIFDFGVPIGTLREGAEADLSVLEEVEGSYDLVDSGGKRRTAQRRLVPWVALLSGREYGSATR
jgi:dihydroorotase